jgi:hypothetical protein
MPGSLLGWVRGSALLRLVLLLALVTSLAGGAAPAGKPAAAGRDAVFFLGARKDGVPYVLAYRTATGALEQFGPAIGLPQAPSPDYEHATPEFHYLLSERPDRVFATLLTFDGSRIVAGDGKRWRPLLDERLGQAVHPSISEDGELLMFDAWAKRKAGSEAAVVQRVATWDGKILDEWRYQDRIGVGFAERGRKWITSQRADGQLSVHEPGAAPRPPRPDEHTVRYDRVGLLSDRYEVNDYGLVLDRKTGNSIGRYRASSPVPGTRSGWRLLDTALASAPGAAVLSVYATTGGCGDVPCFVGSALDLLVIEDGPGAPGAKDGPSLRTVRLWSSPAGSKAAAPTQVRLSRNGAYVAWIQDPHTLIVHDVAAGTARTITTKYELIFAQSLRR